MDLAFLMLADHSESLGGKLYAMGGGWNALRLPSLPHDWGFSIAFAIDVPWDETNRRHELTLHIEDPDGQVLGDPFGMEFEAGRPPGTPAGQDQRVLLSLATRQTFETAGPHATVVKVADREVGRARFYIVETGGNG
jgi:hypothetical protein